MSLASETTAAEKNKGEQASAPHSSPVEPPPWHQIKASPQWQEAVRQTPGLKPFFDNLESFVELPEGVEKLREMVLELAVTGRLETQSNGDPSSNELLESLRSEKARRVKAKELKKGKPTPPIDAEEILHEVPNGWQWVRLQEFGEFCGGGTPSKRKSEFWDGDVPWVSPKDMKSPHIVDSELKITQTALDNTRIRLLPTASVLIVARSGILKRTLPVSINDVGCTVNQDLKVIIPYDTRVSEYLRLMLRGHERYILKHLIKGGVTVQSLKYAEFELQPFPLPPLAEQRRIVSKVEGLMSLCDRLEDARRARESVRERASRSVLVRLTSAPRTSASERPDATAPPRERQGPSETNRRSSAGDIAPDSPTASAKSLTEDSESGGRGSRRADFVAESKPAYGSAGASPSQAVSPTETLASAWQRLSDHFEVLLDHPSGPAHLRQSILQLAVQGKLVPQDPTDEPASEMLEGITARRSELMTEGKINKVKKLPDIEDDEKPFDEIPDSWIWVRVTEVFDVSGGITKNPKRKPVKTTFLISASPTFNEDG